MMTVALSNNIKNLRLLSLLSLSKKKQPLVTVSPSFLASVTRTIKTVHVGRYSNHQSDDDVEDGNNSITNTKAKGISTNIKKNDDESQSRPRRSSPRSRSRRGASKNRQRSLIDERQIPSYKEFVHRFTILSLYRGFLKTIRESMPHNQGDLLKEVQKEFQSCKSDTDPLIIKRSILEGQRRYEELKEFTGESNKYEGSSWINTQDEDDPRGRVGTNWPWER